MRSANEVITIANSELLVSRKAKIALESYIGLIRKKYRLDKNAQKELSTALRDILIEQRKSESATITEKTAREAIAMAGDSYDDRNSTSKLVTRLAEGSSTVLKALKSRVLTEKFRFSMFYVFAFFMLVPIGLLISSLDYFQPKQMVSQQSGYLRTTLGDVSLNNWDNSSTTDDPFITMGNENDKGTYITLVFFVCMCALMVCFAHRSKYSKLIGGLLIIVLITSYSVARNNEAAFEYTVATNTETLYHSAVREARPINAYDTLHACGAQINYVLGEQQGSLYYALKDQGFALGKELANPFPNQEPTRQEICNTYDELRKTHANDNIVLLTFVRDTSGEMLPVDSEQLYGEFATKETKYYEIKYGFFVK